MFFRKIIFFLVFLPVGVCVAQTQDSTEREPSPDRFYIVDQEPKALNLDSIRKQIPYPHANIVGKVIIQILVNKNGNPSKHLVRRNPHPLLTEAVEKQIYSLRFSPAIDKGKPVMSWVSIPFVFK